MKIADGLVLALKVTLRPDMHAFVFALRVRLKARHHRANFVDPPPPLRDRGYDRG